MPECGSCGKDFELGAAQKAKFPGWEPKECTACYRKGAGSSSSRSRKKPSRKGTGRSATVEENLTVEEVLARYHDGPDTGVFTDGSANPNPGPGGWGAVYVQDGVVQARDFGQEGDTTNNRMELTALLHGIALVPEGTPATVYTDSRLAVDTITKWADGWARNGWKRKKGPVKNLDLVKELHALAKRRPEITLEWIAAHSGNVWNEYADALSTAYLRDEV